MLDLLGHVLLAALAIANTHPVILEVLVVLILLLPPRVFFFVVLSTEAFKDEVNEDALANEAKLRQRAEVHIEIFKDELDQISYTIEK
jgi:hypothetical protein